MKSPWTTHSIRKVYENPWIEVTHHEVTTPGGSPGVYGKVHFKNIAVGVVPIDEAGNTWLVGQYRYVLGQYTWEIPEGGCPVGTDPLDTAKRELKEETGLTANSWEQIQYMHLSNSVTDEEGYAFLARDLEFGEAQPEDTEELQIRKLPLQEAVEMIHNGQITDALSIITLLKATQILRS